ncbi:uncharacterized protein LOC133850694 [Drosophila sulfurigaster albostrigata]|uniref:uncharacterized protein LOC133850694 n=1 Tax=Drosophila sulfurigaster albostrigata TaxID=89887 RepID=UPI002D218C26|nr:uncharacterized protein LOC133850694 [Drosophila sulfurigaster albostrigata]
MKSFTYLLFTLIFGSHLLLALSYDCSDAKVNRGEKFQILGECRQYTCIGHESFVALVCPDVANCNKEPDITKLYPQCCPRC